MANNFAEAFLSARNNAQDRTRQREQDAMQRQQFDLQMQGAQQKQQGSQQEALYGLAKGYKDYLSQNPQGGAQYYENFLRPSLSGMGLGDAGPYNEQEAIGLADQVLAAYMPQATQTALAPRVVGNALVDSTGKVLYEAPKESPKPIWDSERGMFIQYPTQGQASAPMGGDVQSLYASLGDKHGFRTTSTTRSEEENNRVGGVPNSQHLSGTARDFSVQGKTPEQINAFANELRSQGFEVITRDHGTGPHIHAELPPGGRQGGGASAISVPGVGPKVKEGPEETFSQPQPVTFPDGSVRLVQFGNRGSRREVEGVTPAPTDRDAKPPTEGERKAATLLKRLDFSLGQLQKAVGESPNAASPSLAAEAARRLPFVGEAAGNSITPAERQRVEAAQLDILDAALTLGTGAAYTREQLEGYRKSYFPQLLDAESTVADKAARLNNVIEAARIAAGRAAPEAGAPASPGGWKIERVK